MSMTRTLPIILASLLCFTLFSASLSSSWLALAQPSESAGADAKTMYRSSYQRTSVDSRNEVAVQSEQRLYTPGQQVRIDGAVWSDLVTEISTSAGAATVSVNIQVTDDEGNVIVERDIQVNGDGDGGDGEYAMSFELPANAETGTYTVVSTINVEVDVLDRVKANIGANIGGMGGAAADINVQTSSKFAVSRPVAFAASAEGGEEFEVNVASNSTAVRDFEFSQEEKKISITVEGESGTSGVTQISVEKAMLSGQMTVTIDGEVVTPESGDVIVVSDTESAMTLEINYSHSEHTVEVTGTNVVPEFPLSLVVMAAAIGSIVAIMAVGKGRISSLIK